MSTCISHTPARERATRRPAGRSDTSRPARREPGQVPGHVRSCEVDRPVAVREVGRAAALRRDDRGPGEWVLGLKVLAVSLVAVVGAIAGVTGYVDAVAVGPSGAPVAGDPAWAHVEP